MATLRSPGEGRVATRPATSIPRQSWVRPTNNTFTLSVRESVQAQAYLRITSLQIGVRTIEFHVYAPPPDDAFCGITFNAYDSFSDAEILKDLQESNPTMPVMGGRHMGRTNHVLVTTLGDCLPRWIFYNGIDDFSRSGLGQGNEKEEECERKEVR
ncbi:hypothetical protein HPB51_009511 [Rhipicephalus microplus]|uniref:Uncharacterized protein n=1 Tax=Rhipicephalus microplus TaxID=6941 RepID=A0A9J6DU63_RHIMP|nr:hypothetical protein HPB51_009511 [Rhipicephalus microplus]